jgi:hypothetical protein
MGTGGIVAAIALFAGVGLAALDHLLALTVGTSDRNEGHRLPFHEQESLCHTLSMQVQIGNTTPAWMASGMKTPMRCGNKGHLCSAALRCHDWQMAGECFAPIIQTGLPRYWWVRVGNMFTLL